MPHSYRQQESTKSRDIAPKKRPSALAEFWHFLRHNKKWWLLPIVIVLLLLGLLVLLGGSAIAPFIYPLF
ncbi:MAG: hypothetical protein AMJ65_01890 [Phycisphaerae bacterium SG8_4]|nr:MAG: hypothetical protein AMJ65_01890 [Phycisphaerae bacterium SG8_4]